SQFLHRHDASRAVPADHTHALSHTDGHIGLLRNNSSLAIIETDGDFQTARFACLMFPRVAGQGAQQAAANRRQNLTATAADRTAGNAAQRAARKSTHAAAAFVLDHHIAHTFDGAESDDLFALRLAIGVDGARRALV